MLEMKIIIIFNRYQTEVNQYYYLQQLLRIPISSMTYSGGEGVLLV